MDTERKAVADAFRAAKQTAQSLNAPFFIDLDKVADDIEKGEDWTDTLMDSFRQSAAAEGRTIAESVKNILDAQIQAATKPTPKP